MAKLRILHCLLFLGWLTACTSVPSGISPVEQFDLERYLGTWYEVARFDHRFERGLSQVTAEYLLQEDGSIKVINRGFNAVNNEWEEAIGKAYSVGDADIGHLKVSFFGPFYASYVIMALDHENYQYALVTGPNREYLWLLARQPNLSASVTETLLNFAQSQGYNTEKLLFVAHGD